MTENLDGLLATTIELSGRKITVYEANGLMGLKRASMEAEIITNPHDDPYVTTFLVNVYVPLVCCSRGAIPKDRDEFLSMKEADIEAWTVEARKLNKMWFGWLDAAEQIVEGELTKEQKKKKVTKRRKSTKH